MAARHMLRLRGAHALRTAQRRVPTRAAAGSHSHSLPHACVRAGGRGAGLQRADLLVARGQAALQRLDLAPQHGDAGRVAADVHEGRRRRHADLDAAAVRAGRSLPQ